MNPNNHPKVYLLTSEALEKTNHSTIAQLFISSLNILWPEGIHHERVLLFTSDAASYMKKAATGLKIIFPKMLHLTCLAHALHRVAEEIRSGFSDVDRLISNGKKVFLKAPSRIEIFKRIAPGVPLPPQPVLTRWGTWISACTYYAENFSKISEIFDNLDEEGASAIRIVKHLLQKPNVKNDLIFISSNYSALPQRIKELEKRGDLLTNSCAVFQDAVNKIAAVPGDKGSSIFKKIERVLSANSDYIVVKNISDSFCNKQADVDLDLEHIVCFKYAPVTSVEVERSFSRLKYILSDRRQGFTVENLKKYLVTNCNFVNNDSDVDV